MSDTQNVKQRPAGVRNSNTPCAVAGCASTAYYASGMCAMHHRRMQRTGGVGPAAPTRGPRQPKKAS